MNPSHKDTTEQHYVFQVKNEAGEVLEERYVGKENYATAEEALESIQNPQQEESSDNDFDTGFGYKLSVSPEAQDVFSKDLVGLTASLNTGMIKATDELNIVDNKGSLQLIQADQYVQLLSKYYVYCRNLWSSSR